MKKIFLFLFVLSLISLLMIKQNTTKVENHFRQIDNKISHKGEILISEKIKFARIERKMSCREVAEAVGIALSQYEKIERNEAMPSKDLYKSLEKILDIK